MLVYEGDVGQFRRDVEANRIHHRIETEYERKLFRSPPRNEKTSWQQSMQYMERVVNRAGLDDGVGVAIEFVVPTSSKRVDFMLTGADPDGNETAVVVELKQWSEVERTDLDGLVRTWVGSRYGDHTHPSYQALSYAHLIRDFNATVRQDDIRIESCAYMHNLQTDEVVRHDFYDPYTSQAPVFIAPEAEQLADFLRRHVRAADRTQVMYRIDKGRIRPSKSLADHVGQLLAGNPTFMLLGDQKVAYEHALDIASRGQKKTGSKQVMIVHGGPGTGKSVVAVNLLAELLQREHNVRYVSKNSAPRTVYAAALEGQMRAGRIKNLFSGSAGFVDAPVGEFDTLLVDEAHRLVAKTRFNGGENQVKELIAAAKTTIFFLDEDQRVSTEDLGSTAEVERWAAHWGAEVTHRDLASQFRCNGSDGYLAWLDDVLDVRQTANPTFDGIDYDFRVFDDPVELRREIHALNAEANKARLLAGYCWPWRSKQDPNAMDIVLDGGFEAQWNLTSDGMLWAVGADTVHQVGCIHTSQGLEVDYVGVIVGPDLVVRDGAVVTDFRARDRGDKTISGLKGRAKTDPIAAAALADEIIKNTYRTLMTRGQKGCLVHCTDPETNAYFRERLELHHLAAAAPAARYPGLELRVIESDDVDHELPPNAVPIFETYAAAGEFSEHQETTGHDYVELPAHINPPPGAFVVRVVGESMNKRIPNGSWCLFRPPTAGSRDGRIVLVEHRDIADEYGGTYTVKQYRSLKVAAEDNWSHNIIELHPMTSSHGYTTVRCAEDRGAVLHHVGDLVTVL